MDKEKSECLTREASLVKQHDGLRRTRKGLLSDLSSLVKTAKNFQDIANGTPTDEEVEYVLDEMLRFIEYTVISLYYGVAIEQYVHTLYMAQGYNVSRRCRWSFGPFA